MPHFPLYEHREPNWVDFESYYLTRCDNNCRTRGRYGEPITRYREELCLCSGPSSPAYPEDVFELTGKFWNENGLCDQTYHNEMQPLFDWERVDYGSNCGGDLKDEIFGFGFDYKDGRDGNGLEKAGNFDEGEELRRDGCYCYDDYVEEWPVVDYESWLRYGEDEDFQEEEHGGFSPGYSGYETGLCERIFGPWPCLSRTVEESCVEDEVAYMDLGMLSKWIIGLI